MTATTLTRNHTTSVHRALIVWAAIIVMALTAAVFAAATLTGSDARVDSPATVVDGGFLPGSGRMPIS